VNYSIRGVFREVLISRQVTGCSHRGYTYVHFPCEDASKNETKIVESQPS